MAFSSEKFSCIVSLIISFPVIISMLLFHFTSVTKSHSMLCNHMDCSTPGLAVHHQFPEFAQTHVHWVSDAIQPSHPLSSPSSAAFNVSQHQGLSSESVLPSGGQSIGALASAGLTGWISLQSKGPSRVLQTTVQNHQLKKKQQKNPSILLSSVFFIVQLSHPYMATGKTMTLTRQTFVGKVMSLLMLHVICCLGWS